MSDRQDQANFQLTGQLIDIVWKNGHIPKYFKLMVQQQELWIKIPKPLRYELDPRLTVKSWVQITGTFKRDKKTGILKLKAETVELVNAEGCATLKPIKANKVTTILVCQKSSCRKRGADHICERLEATVEQAGLLEQVKIKKTGCLKQCKHGPNLVFMPDKAKYSRVRSNEIAPLVQKHVTEKVAAN
ncbi:MAG: (2Fe-2S) ferredoxin domain-containing protein [Spirulina sp. SIO3F2]|nr:(2Fe-2S) ferredoxin domain-containing protein [Spirulina sp. SIO3F2]